MDLTGYVIGILDFSTVVDIGNWKFTENLSRQLKNDGSEMGFGVQLRMINDAKSEAVTIFGHGDL